MASFIPAAYAMAAAIACVLRRLRSTRPPHVRFTRRPPSLFHRRPPPGRVLPPGDAAAQADQVTFVLVNDIYLMGDKMMPDGRRRGGFARLAAVVKAERAKGGHVIFAHAGDTLSPSLMSGLDHGAHIITLTNMIPPDIFAPGNHEFDFGKDVFFERMKEAKFPLYAANLRDDGRQAAAEFPGPLDRRRSTACASGSPAPTLDDTPRHIEPRGPGVPADCRDHAAAGRAAAQGGRRFRGRGDPCRPQAGLRDVRDPRRST